MIIIYKIMKNYIILKGKFYYIYIKNKNDSDYLIVSEKSINIILVNFIICNHVFNIIISIK